MLYRVIFHDKRWENQVLTDKCSSRDLIFEFVLLHRFWFLDKAFPASTSDGNIDSRETILRFPLLNRVKLVQFMTLKITERISNSRNTILIKLELPEEIHKYSLNTFVFRFKLFDRNSAHNAAIIKQIFVVLVFLENFLCILGNELDFCSFQTFWANSVHATPSFKALVEVFYCEHWFVRETELDETSVYEI